jgi:ribosomal protein S17
MKTADGGELLEGRFSLGGITSFHQAQEHAEIILRRSRNSLRVSLKASGEAMNLIVGDIVSITHSTPSFSAKPFRVSGVTLNKDHTVNLNLRVCRWSCNY